jgi:hypothetical protein
MQHDAVGCGLKCFFVYYRAIMCWCIVILALANASNSKFTLDYGVSLLGVYKGADCTGANLLVPLWGEPTAVGPGMTITEGCHSSKRCGWLGSVNFTFASNDGARGFGVGANLTVQIYQNSFNCSGGNLTLVVPGVPLRDFDQRQTWCQRSAGGSLLIGPNYEDPEGAPQGYSQGYLGFFIFFSRLGSYAFAFLLYGSILGLRNLTLVDGYKVNLEAWELSAAGRSAYIFGACSLALIIASQLLYVADFFQDSPWGYGCTPATSFFPISWFWLSFALELAALLCLILAVQLRHLAVFRFCYGGSACYTLTLPLAYTWAVRPNFMPGGPRPQRSPCTLSTALTSLSLTLFTCIAAISTLTGALGAPSAPLFTPESYRLVQAAMVLMWCSVAGMLWGMWCSRGVTGVGCHRRNPLETEPMRYTEQQAISDAELFSPLRLLLKAAERVRCLRGCMRAALGRLSGASGGAGGGGAGAPAVAAPFGGDGGAATTAELYLLHLGPSDTAERLKACLECWNAKRACPGTGRGGDAAGADSAATAAAAAAAAGGGGGRGGGTEDETHSLAHQCPICYEGTLGDRPWLALSPCAHLFHAHCIERWVKTAHGSRTGLPSCPMDQSRITRRPYQSDHNSWDNVAAEEEGSRLWTMHRLGPEPVQTFYSCGARRLRQPPQGAIVMSPVLFNDEEEGEEEEEEVPAAQGP